jgi:succinate-acetate transporter protein
VDLTDHREIALGNTFGATALASYGGFWIGTAIILTPGGFQIASTLEADSPNPFLDSFGLYLMGWFIFTFLLLICTLRSTVAFFTLFFTLDLAFLFLGLAYLEHGGTGGPHTGLLRAGGAFGILAAFTAWYVHFPQSVSRPSLTTYKVQRPRRYCRPQQLILPDPRRSLPVVR